MTITLTSYIVEAGRNLRLRVHRHLGARRHGADPRVVNLAYWAHMVAISTFLLIPVSKHMHLVMALPNVFFHDLRPMGTMLPMATNEDGTAVGLDDLDLESFGAVNYTDLTWRSLIDGWACTPCARCQTHVRPTPLGRPSTRCKSSTTSATMRTITRHFAFGRHARGRPHRTHWRRRHLRVHDLPRVEACPIYIDHVPKLTDARRHLMMERMEFNESVEEVVLPLMSTIENIENEGNPYGIPAHERGDWAEGLDVKVAEPAEYIYLQAARRPLTTATRRSPVTRFP